MHCAALKTMTTSIEFLPELHIFKISLLFVDEVLYFKCSTAFLNINLILLMFMTDQKSLVSCYEFLLPVSK